MSLEESYIILARKYRPQKLSELIGQDVLAKTLNYSMKSGKLAQAYLLNGMRGVGKTTTARIIAKTINCSSPKHDKGNTNINSNENKFENYLEACDSCDNCLAVLDNRHPDINEIDAASRTSVEDIRKIIEDSEYRPLLAKYKVFIVDEVHMLSKSAFNALLKLLEEPPPHVIFIFATTEITKVPLTVRSRCQHFILKRLSTEEITELLNIVSAKEALKCTKDGLNILASKSDGSARDALALLEQARSFSQANDKTSEESVIDLVVAKKMCGLVELQPFINLIEAIVLKDASTAMKIIEELYLLGQDFKIYNETLLELLGYLIKVKTIDGFKDVSYSSYSAKIEQLLPKLSVTKLTMLWQLVVRSEDELKFTHNQKLSFEITIIKAIHVVELPTPDSILKQLTEISTRGNLLLPRQEFEMRI